MLSKRLNEEGYFEASTTPGLWSHKWQPIQLNILVDGFGLEYVGRKHVDHLASVLKNYHEISED